jgi:hypothetical protein
MLGVRFTILPKAFVLWTLCVPGVGSLGVLLGTWPLPVILTLVRAGWTGLEHLSTDAYVFASIPPWIEPGPPPNAAYFFAFLGQALPMLFGAVIFGRLGERLYRYLVVKKLHWMTQEEVDAARKREKQYF